LHSVAAVQTIDMLTGPQDAPSFIGRTDAIPA